MADKFLSLRSDKQRVLAFEVERLGTPDGERPVVVTAERDRIAVFCGAADGSWVTRLREHEPLDVTPRRPEHTDAYGWSRRIGVASSGDRIVLAYKRVFRFEDDDSTSNPADLWLDVLSFDAAGDRLDGGAPILFPRQRLRINRFGFGVWADRFDDRLVVVAQAFPAVFQFPQPVDELPPQLVLLTALFPAGDGGDLASGNSWAMTVLDEGGWDLDVRRKDDRLYIVHRRVPATYEATLAAPIDPAFNPRPVVLLDEPEDGAVGVTATSGMVLLEATLPDGTVTNLDESVPFGELPRIQSLDPIVITAERLQSTTLEFGRVNSRSRVSAHEPRWRTFLVMLTTAGWRAASLFAEARDWPCTLVDMVPAHFLLGLRFINRAGLHLEFTTLFPNNPVELFGIEETDKGTLMAFAHRDPVFASLRATTFRVFLDDGGNTLKAQAEAYSIVDLGHRRMRVPRNAARPVEYARFEPFRVTQTVEHEDGFDVRRRELNSANTLAWGLAAADERPHTFFAYADMGDGGGRVAYDQALVLPPPGGQADDKTFRIDTVPEPTESGRAWVRLETPDFVDAGLTSYFVPPFAPPRSLLSNLQRALDALPLAAIPTIQAALAGVANQLEGGGELVFTDAEHIGNPAFVQSVTLTRGTADAIEEFAVGVGEREPVTSDRNQPFSIEFGIFPSTLFASQPIVFQARVPGFATDEVSYLWEFSDGTTATDRNVEKTFAATVPDLSSRNPVDEDSEIEVTLTVTAPDGRTSTASTSFPLPASLWATLWSGYAPFRRRPDDVFETGEALEQALSPGFFATSVAVDLLKYRIEYTTTEAGEGSALHVAYKNTHVGRFQFKAPNTPGQGEVDYELPIAVALAGVRLTGNLGSALAGIVAIDRVTATMRYRARFQPCIQTSERRLADESSDTVILRGGDDPRMAPSALCCLPIGDTSLPPTEPQVASRLADAARNLTILVAALIAGGLTAVVVAALVAVLVIVAPAAIVGVIISGGIAAILNALLGAGAGWLATLALEAWVVRPLVTDVIRSGLNHPSVKRGFDTSGLMTYAGEGLAETLAVHVIRRAQADGHAVDDPELQGRDRFRPQFFETIVAEEGGCKAKIRVL